MYRAALILILGGAVVSCGGGAPGRMPEPLPFGETPARVPKTRIERLDHRIATLPKVGSLPLPQVLKRLGLWEYRHALRTSRRSNVACLEFNDGQTLCFIAEEEPKAHTKEDVPINESEWDHGIKNLHIWRIIYRGHRTDLSEPDKPPVGIGT